MAKDLFAGTSIPRDLLAEKVMSTKTLPNQHENVDQELLDKLTRSPTDIYPFAAGALQGFANLGAAIPRMVLGENAPRPDVPGAIDEVRNLGIGLPQVTKETPGFGFGNLTADLLPISKSIGGANKILNKSFPEFAFKNPIKTSLASGALGGGAYGAFRIPEEGETRSGNTLTDALLFPAIELGIRGIGAGIKGVKNTYNDVQNYFKTRKNLKENAQYKSDLESQLHEIEMQNEAKRRDYAGNVGEIKNALEEEAAKKKKGIELGLPNSREEAISNLTKELTKAHEEGIKPEINKKFESFKKSAGTSEIKEPLSFENLNQYDINNMPAVMQKLMAEIGGQQEAIPQYLMQEFGGATGSHVVRPSIKPNVNKYLELSRMARDEKFKASEDSINPNLTASEKEVARNRAIKMGDLQNELDRKINESLTNEQRNQYASYKADFQNLELPFRKSSLLAKATSREPKVKTNNFYESFIKENYPKLKEYLLQKHPEVGEAIQKHDLRNLDMLNPNAIEKVMRSDLGKTFSKKTKDDLRSLVSDLRNIDLMEKLMQAGKANELGLISKSPEINKIIQKYPFLGEPLKTLQEGLERERFIKKKLKEAGLSEKKIKEQLADYKKINKSRLKKLGYVGLGGTTGAALTNYLSD